MSIQQYKADSLKIKLYSEYEGFEVVDMMGEQQLNFVVDTDEMRLKQVLMNL